MFNKSYNVKLEIFEGPMDLLLHLIKKNEVDVYDIPISIITDQYLEYVEVYKSLNLEMAGEYLVMAANLIHIKSKMLLPIDEEPDDEEEIDPRAELVRRLIEYKRFKEVAEALGDQHILGRDVFIRGFPFPLDNLEEQKEEPQLDLELMDLIEAFKDVLKKAPKDLRISFSVDKFHVVDKINHIMERINVEKSADFFSLFPEGATRGEIIVTFLAILELCKRVMVKVSQRDAQGGITLYLPDQLVEDAEGNLPEEIKEEMAENVVQAVAEDFEDLDDYGGGDNIGYDEEPPNLSNAEDEEDDFDLDELNRELDAEPVNKEEVESRLAESRLVEARLEEAKRLEEEEAAKAEADLKREEVQEQISEARTEVADEKRSEVQQQLSEIRTEVADEKRKEIQGQVVEARIEASPLNLVSESGEEDLAKEEDSSTGDLSNEEPPPHLKDDEDDQADLDENDGYEDSNEENKNDDESNSDIENDDTTEVDRNDKDESGDDDLEENNNHSEEDVEDHNDEDESEDGEEEHLEQETLDEPEEDPVVNDSEKEIEEELEENIEETIDEKIDDNIQDDREDVREDSDSEIEVEQEPREVEVSVTEEVVSNEEAVVGEVVEEKIEIEEPPSEESEAEDEKEEVIEVKIEEETITEEDTLVEHTQVEVEVKEEETPEEITSEPKNKSAVGKFFKAVTDTVKNIKNKIFGIFGRGRA